MNSKKKSGAMEGEEGSPIEINPSHDLEIDPAHQHPQDAPLDEADDLSLSEAIERLEQTEDLIRKHQDDVLRVQAEMQNLRRRTELDVEKAHKYGQERLVTELLSVMDNLERALVAASGMEDDRVGAIYDGVDLTLKSFQECFRKFSIEVIDPLGEPFDPLKHQAMALVDNPEVEPNTVTAVMQKGYSLHGRVIRPAMVMVSRAG
ncbi:MAG: nucleotide exchange factor GrpE [Pseudohongiellaceae bacterium]